MSSSLQLQKLSSSVSKSKVVSLDTKTEDDHVSPIFNAGDADLILRSLDGVDFRVYRQILAIASTVWADMFSLGASIQEDSESSKSASPPVVSVTDKASALSDILRFVYPIPKPDVQTLEQCSDLIAIAEKYDVTGAIPLLRNILMSPKFLKEYPIRVYSIACSYAWAAEAREASRYTLSYDIMQTPVTPELHRITGVEFLKLLQLHRQRAKAAAALLSSVQAVNCNCGTPPIWFKQWEIKAREELSIKPTTDVIFSFDFATELFMTVITSCANCPRSFMAAQSQAQLKSCKERIDALPDTV